MPKTKRAALLKPKDFICRMREREESKVKPKVWMVEEGASMSFDEISIERKNLRSRKDLQKYMRLNLEGLILKNIESLQEMNFSNTGRNKKE